jgi:hypothetical protein
MKKGRQIRQVYNKNALNKMTQIQKQNNTRRINKKINAEEIITNVYKSDYEEEKNKKSDNESIDNIENKIENNENNEEDSKNKEKIKEKVQRLKLDDKTLLYSENGMKKYYEIITSYNFSNKDNKKNLDQLTSLFRNWHFLLFPNYDVDFFTNKLIDLGKKSSIKSYMSRLRRIYKGEESWDIMYDEQNDILGKGTIMKGKRNKEKNNKLNNDNNNNNINNSINNNNDNNTKFNLNEIDIKDNEYNAIIEDLILENEDDDINNNNNNVNIKNEHNNLNNNINDNNINNNRLDDVKDSDFDNFDYDPEEEFLKNKRLNESQVQKYLMGKELNYNFSSNHKRTYSEISSKEKEKENKISSLNNTKNYHHN